MSSLKGAVIDGYVVGEVLGSGASGLLYEAIHEATGRQAIVRLAGADGDDARLIEVFAQEASGLLVGSGRPVVRRSISADGRALLVVEKVGPGEGRSEHTVTDRLPGRTPRTPPQRRGLAMLAGAALVLAISAIVMLLVRTPAPVSEPPRIAAPQPSAPPELPEPPAPPPTDAPVAKALAPAPPPRPPVRVAPKPAVPDTCRDLSRWRLDAQREMTALENYVARDDALYDAFDKARGTFDYAGVVDADGCARFERALDTFYAAHGLAR